MAPRWGVGTPVPVFTPGTDAGRVCTRALHDAKPTKHTQPFTGERGQFGMDAEIRTHQALHEAKPSECPKGDRDNKSEVYFKNRLFLQTEKSLALRQDSFAFYLEYYMQLMQLFALLSGI